MPNNFRQRGRFHVRDVELSDGSHVYDVVFTTHDGGVVEVYFARDERDARVTCSCLNESLQP